MKRKLFILLIIAVALLMLATGCHEEDKIQPTSSGPGSKTQQEQTEQGQEPGTPPATAEQPQVQFQGPEKTASILGFGSEAGLIQQIWGQFQKDQGKLKTGQDLNLWLENTIAQVGEGGKAKSDPSLKAYMISLLKICLNDSHNPLCQAPWELIRYEIPIYKKTLSVSQLESLRQQFREILKPIDYAKLTAAEMTDTAARMVDLLFGDTLCQQNICPFDEVFSQLGRLSNELKLKLLAELLRPIERQARLQQWQSSGGIVNVVIRMGG